MTQDEAVKIVQNALDLIELLERTCRAYPNAEFRASIYTGLQQEDHETIASLRQLANELASGGPSE